MIRRHDHKQTGPIGIDLGSGGVRMIQFADPGGQCRVAVMAEEPGVTTLPPTEAGYYEATMAAAQRMLDRNGFTGRQAVIVLPNQAVRTKNIRMPEMPESDLSSAVSWEAAERFGFDPGAAMQTRHLVAGTVQQGADHRLEVLIMAASSALIDGATQAVLDHGFEPLALEVTPCVLSYAAAACLPAHPTRVLVDLGASATKVVICTDHGPRFYKTIDIGLSALDRHTQDTLTHAGDDPAGLRARFQEQSPQVQADYTQAIAPWIDELAQEIALCLRYDAVTYRGNRAAQVFFLGGGADLPGLGECLQDKAGVEVHALNPFQPISAEDDPAPPGMALRWVAAAGAAWRPRFVDPQTAKGAA